MRPDASRWLRADHADRKYRAERLPPPARHSDADEWSSEQDTAPNKALIETELSRTHLARLRWLVAELKLDMAMRRFARVLKAGFDPNQPRVPAGNPDGGQWTSGGGRSRVRLAASDKPRLGRAALALELAKRAIEAFRSENFLRDLFGSKIGTVAYTTVDGQRVFGSNSISPTYGAEDYVAAERMRSILIERYPSVMSVDNIGERPNDALFHAEATILLRAARQLGGTLTGRTLEVFADRPLCASCQIVLPYLARELGNPTVVFVGPGGLTQTIRDGTWVR